MAVVLFLMEPETKINCGFHVALLMILHTGKAAHTRKELRPIKDSGHVLNKSVNPL